MAAKRKSKSAGIKPRKTSTRIPGQIAPANSARPGKKNAVRENENKVDSDLQKKEIESIPILNMETYFRIIEKYCDTDDVLFRGQRSDWPLLPKLSRITVRASNVLESEKEMMYDFKRLTKPHLQTIPGNDWEWLAIAQHHGMATRLLDWTTNPLAALWFAVSQPALSEYGVVWIFFLDKGSYLKSDELVKTNPFTENRAKVFQPELSSARIQVQSGWFTTQEVDGRNNKFIAFDEINAYQDKLIKLKIPKDSFSSLRYQLDRLALNQYALFPGVDGTAAYIEWKHSIIADESD